MARLERLTAAKAATITRPGKYADGGGLYVSVKAYETGKGVQLARSWLFRFERDGVERWMGLGPLHTVSLKGARERARAARESLLDGLDPIDARNEKRAARRLEAARALTFKECAERYIEAHRQGWANAKHAAQWTSTLESYAYPILGALPVAGVDTGLIVKVLEPIWTAKPETASRVRGRVERVIDWAAVRGYRAGDNPARWRGHLDKVLPPRAKIAAVRHHPALPYTEIATFTGELRELNSVSARALDLTILAATRTSETVGARWAEFDLNAKTWTIPAERMKAKRAHRVPLCDRAVEILRGLPKEHGNDHVFIGARDGGHLSTMAMLQCLRGMKGRGGLTVHGFRSTFRDWAAEQTNFPRELAEAALAHVLTNKVEAAYQRGDLFEKRRRVMDEWARYCEPKPRGQVVSMRRARNV